ncbi:HsdM family class I SAM-dependent methyltransferase [Actinocorallia lasiicapitis]
MGGTASAPLFALSDVREWLDSQGKGKQVADEVRLWQALRAERPEDMPAALAATAAALAGEPHPQPLGTSTLELADGLAAERSAAGLLADLAGRFVASAGHGGGGEHVSTTALVKVVRHFAGTTTGTVYDPACGIGDLLLACGGPDAAERFGQDSARNLTEFVRLRADLAAPPIRMRTAVGDSLRDDRFPDLKADLVVCDPPTGQPDWGRDDLMLDPRWELGLPPKAEGDLAWLQHCYFHTAPGGRALVVLPASAAYRRSGRRLRGDLVRNGMLDTLVALPGGLVPGHAAPVHLWILRRPPLPNADVRLIDLSDADLTAPLDIPETSIARVAPITLLGDELDLTPSHHVAKTGPDHAAAYATALSGFEAALAELYQALPTLTEGDGDLPATLNLSDLIRAGLVDLDDNQPRSTTPQLDTDFLRGFLSSPANTRRNTSGSGTFRADPRSARVPQMDAARQRAYGTTFRDLESFLHRLEEAAKIGRRAVQLARDGLTTGTLTPPAPSPEGTIPE